MKKQSRILPALTFAALAAVTLVINSGAAETPAQLARPDGKPADQTKKVRVFILMGQSNMVGMGDVEPADKPGTLTTLTKTEKSIHFSWTTRASGRCGRMSITTMRA